MATIPDPSFCACCEPRTPPAPLPIYNRPGLRDIAWRSGSYATFRQAMVEAMATGVPRTDNPDDTLWPLQVRTALSALTTRDDADYAILALDLFAAIADVLGFYSERYVNELYLRTARERDSLLRLVRLIGYRFAPGLAATTTLAFTLDTGGAAKIRSGLKVMSVPGPDEVAQVYETIAPLAQNAGALFIACVNPISLGLLTPPGEYGADIAVAEGQSLGIPPGYGGPFLGLFACKTKWLRKMPGRLVGQTVDVDGKRAFVLTLQAREQHIRREKATSNVCTTTALIGSCATFYMSLLGKQGLRDVSYQNLAKARYAFTQWTQIPGVRAAFRAPFFNEFVLQTKTPFDLLQQRLLERGSVAGLPIKKWYPELENASLWCITETKTKQDIDLLTKTLKEIQ